MRARALSSSSFKSRPFTLANIGRAGRSLPPSRLWTGMPARLPMMSHSAPSIALIALLASTLARQ